MSKKFWFVGLSLLPAAALVVGGLHVRRDLLNRKAARNVSIAKSKWEAAKGVQLTFNEPLDAVTWSVNGRTSTIRFMKPATSVWLKTSFPQGKKSTIKVRSVETTYKQHIAENWRLSDILPASMKVVTNPGPWQLNVPRKGPYTVQFSAPIQNRTKATQDISFAPNISGKWVWENADTAAFYPAHEVAPAAQEKMLINSGKTGPISTSGQYLSTSVTRNFITASNEKIVVREKLPETLTLYKNGKAIFHSLCNTAVKGAHTPLGQFYIRTKYLHVDMKGVNPNGTHYNDPNVPWVMGLIGSIAIHGFPRASYGFPQSNGCVELPVKIAKKLYSMVKVGTPVEITKS
ncbi:L,D-transpeptidase [Alicyclobacillus sp. SO9]|uniref:L,D-transpeptidase n=1 Tax=Alicyclobacillus sp. SO9 TaxID=2665646 RepID=UPI0018E88850|nr:L,D-transpeptidase [Alicyclobacillus sp. SO9]QQE78308.1 L,D-transpeptidase [Alicyclobacillus sp. SO9]